jgi:phosphoglycolate phosphatase
MHCPLPLLPFYAALIDLDGTLIDTRGDFVAALNAMLEDLGLPPSIDVAFVERTVGKGSEHLIRRALIHAEATEDFYSLAFLRYQHHYLQLEGQYSTVYEGVMEGLAHLRERRIPLACVTNKPLALTRPLLQAKGIDRFFDQVFGGDSFEQKKPHPMPLIKACESLGTPVERTVMIGDSSNDAQAADRAKCPVILVSYGYNHGQPIRQTAAFNYVDRLDHVIQWF